MKTLHLARAEKIDQTILVLVLVLNVPVLLRGSLFAVTVD